MLLYDQLLRKRPDLYLLPATRLFVFFLRYDRCPCCSPIIPQFPLFQFTLPETSGNNERRAHGKIICLPTSHTAVRPAVEPPLRPFRMFILRLVLDTILNLLLALSRRLPSRTKHPEGLLQGGGSSFGLPSLISAELSLEQTQCRHRPRPSRAPSLALASGD